MCHFLTSRCSSFPPKSYSLNVIFRLNIAGTFLRENGKSELYHVQFLDSLLTNLQRGLNTDSSALLRAELRDLLRELRAAQIPTRAAPSIHRQVPKQLLAAGAPHPCQGLSSAPSILAAALAQADIWAGLFFWWFASVSLSNIREGRKR